MSKAAFALLLLAAGSDVFTSKEGRFHARFKSPPRYKETTSGEGSAKVVNHFFMSTLGKATYMVYFLDLTPEVSAENDDAPLLEMMLGGALANAQLTLKSKKQIRVGDFPALEYQAADGPVLAAGRVVRAKERIYIVSVIDDAGKLTDAKAFLESFGVEKAK